MLVSCRVLNLLGKIVGKSFGTVVFFFELSEFGDLFRW